ncbi:MAG TPA: hypothetical protein VF077_08840 [Nitrospiraceae bacterium]
MRLKLDHKIERLDRGVIESLDLTDRFEQSDLDKIGLWVHDGYKADKMSRQPWEKRTEAALDLAMQLAKAKSFPWPNCSNIAFPIVTIGAMQFHSRAYPTIINGTDIVKMRVVGQDEDGLLTNQASRISQHMSYQVLEEDQCWEEQHDRLLLIIAVVGCAFVKTYYSPKLSHNVSELVMARDLIVNYWAKGLDGCDRKTHRLPMSRNDIRERVLEGLYCDVLDEPWFQEPPVLPIEVQQQRSDKRIGQSPPEQSDDTTPFNILEQHCNVDLDQDGYDEPYIVTIEEQSKKTLRIVSRVESPDSVVRVQVGQRRGEIITTRAQEYFTKYSFIPSPDGGIYDVGFGVLLGPLNESVNSLINQLVDAGTMANTAGGFLARGAKVRGGVYTFAPFEWNRVDSTGDDLRKSIFPLPVRDPSAVLFQLLGLLIDYCNRVSGANDAIVGENPGQNTPAQTTQSMIEMGMKIYNAIFKRVWRSMKEEFKKLYILNGLNLEGMGSFGSQGTQISRTDYKGDSNKVVPAADPNITSDTQLAQQALMLKQFAATTPGYNQEKVERKVLKALHYDDIDGIFPGPGKEGATQPPQDPKLVIEQMKDEREQAKVALEKMKTLMELKEQVRVNDAEIVETLAKAKLYMEQAGDVRANTIIQQINAAIGAAKQHSEHLNSQIDALMRGKEIQQEDRKLDIEDKKLEQAKVDARRVGNSKG